MSTDNEQMSDRLMPILTVFQEDLNEEVSLMAQDLMAKAGLADENIAYVLDQVRPLLSKPVTNDEDLDALQKGAITPLMQMRVRIEKLAKRGRERANMERTAWINVEKEAIARFKDVEDAAMRMKEEYKESVRKAKEAEQRAYEAQLQYRYARLEEAGAIRRAATASEPDRYVISGASYPVADIDSMDGPTLDTLVRSALMLKEEAEREEAEKRAEYERMTKAAAELAERERAINAKIVAMRTAELRAIGAGPSDYQGDIASVPDDEWGAILEATERAVAERNRIKAEQEERLRAEGVERERLRQQAEQERAEEAERERMAQMGDADCIVEYIAEAQAMLTAWTSRGSKMNSAIGKHGVSTACKHLGAIITVLTGTRKDIA